MRSVQLTHHVKEVPQKIPFSSCHYHLNHSISDIDMFGYIDVNYRKERSPEV